MKLALTLILALPLMAAGPLHTVAVATQDTVEYTGGVIHLATGYGEVNVEPWDQPNVAVTVTRTTFRHTGQDAQGKQYLQRIQVKVTRASNGDINIVTTFPGRNWLARTFHGLGDFNLDYRIQAPPNAKLAIDQHIGDVIVYGMSGNIDAHVHAGDVVIQLPSPEKAAIDAKTDLGSNFIEIPSDKSAAQHLRLRSGIGGVTVQ